MRIYAKTDKKKKTQLLITCIKLNCCFNKNTIFLIEHVVIYEVLDQLLNHRVIRF